MLFGWQISCGIDHNYRLGNRTPLWGVVFGIDGDTVHFVVKQPDIFFSDTLSSSTPFKVINQKIQTCNNVIIVTIKRWGHTVRIPLITDNNDTQRSPHIFRNKTGKILDLLCSSLQVKCFHRYICPRSLFPEKLYMSDKRS